MTLTLLLPNQEIGSVCPDDCLDQECGRSDTIFMTEARLKKCETSLLGSLGEFIVVQASCHDCPKTAML